MKSKYQLIESCKKIHFIGIGGISMSTLAVIASKRGLTVTGSDDNPDNKTVKDLVSMGITVFSPLLADNIRDAELVVYTAAVHSNNPELVCAIEKGIPCISRAEYLGYIMTGYEKRIGVSGTHGKSTTTAMLFEIFNWGEGSPTLACGAVLPSLDRAYKIGDEECFIYEACEYTDSFLHFNPTTAVITNIELDHVDYFKDLDSLILSFSKSIKDSEKAVVLADDENCMRAVEGYDGEKITVSLIDKSAIYYGGDINCHKGFYSFDLIRKGSKLCRIELGVPGYHNVANALCACACAIENGAEPEECVCGIKKFRGIGRRFEYKGNVNGGDVYIDYAHHPSEIKATLETARSMEPNRIIAVFQSHTYTRTAKFANEFAQSLSECDKVIIAPIYPARESIDLKLISEEQLAEMIPGAVSMDSFDSITDTILDDIMPGDMILFLGAGNINTAAPMLIEKNKRQLGNRMI